MLRVLILAALLSSATTDLHAQRSLTANVLSRDTSQAPPRASLADIAWLAGHWRGPGLGGISEEIWAPALGGSMMGSYRLVRGDSVIFYEIMTLTEADSSLVLRLKHFDAALTGWEEKGQVVSFPLVRMTPTVAYFDGMTIRRLDGGTLQVHVAVGAQDGRVQEEEFRYTRVTPAFAPAEAP